MPKPIADTLPNDPPPKRGGALMIVGVLLVIASLVGLVGILCLSVTALGWVMTTRSTTTVIDAKDGPVVIGSGVEIGPGVVIGSGGDDDEAISLDGLEPVGADPSELSTLKPDEWHDVLSIPPSPHSHFDAFDSLDWATDLARNWQPDVVLIRLDVDHLRKGMPLDLVNDEEAEVDYWFYSPSQYELAQKAAEVTEKEIPTGVRLWLQEGKVQVMIDTIDPPKRFGKVDPRFVPFDKMGPGCNQDAVFKAVLEHPETPRRPAFDLGMRWRFNKAYVIDTSPGDAYIDPKTCGPWRR